MFWKKDDSPATDNKPALEGSVSQVDAAAEKDRIAKLTGNKAVVIQREGKSKIKLPGL